MKLAPTFIKVIYHIGGMAAAGKTQEGRFNFKSIGLELLIQLVGYVLAYFVMSGAAPLTILMPFILCMWLVRVQDDNGVDYWKQNHLALGICLGLLTALFSSVLQDNSYVHWLIAVIYIQVAYLGFRNVTNPPEPS